MPTKTTKHILEGNIRDQGYNDINITYCSTYNCNSCISNYKESNGQIYSPKVKQFSKIKEHLENNIFFYIVAILVFIAGAIIEGKKEIDYLKDENKRVEKNMEKLEAKIIKTNSYIDSVGKNCLINEINIEYLKKGIFYIE